MIGPVKSSIDISQLNEFSNFKLILPTEGEALQALIQQMDVCIIPFNAELEVVKACTPNKTFQYIACGKPIVMSNMDHLIKFPEKFIYTAKDGQEFIDLIRQAYQEDSEGMVASRLALAMENSWKKRGDDLQMIIQSCAAG